MLFVLDTNVIVAAVRSPTGASAALLRQVLRGERKMVASVALFLEYEATLSRSEHLAASGATLAEIEKLLDTLASVVVPCDIRFLWRPQLRDPNDDMVLELAVNAGANRLVTFNVKDFLPQAQLFGLRLQTPRECLKNTGDTHGHPQ